MPTKPSVLVVDDESIVRMLLKTELESAGLEVVLAADMEEALDIAAMSNFAVAMIDKNLPDGDGIDLIRKLHDRDPELEAIVMTGYASIESAIEAMGLGVFDYLTKPFDHIDVTIQRVKRAIEKRDQQRELKALVENLSASNRQLEESMSALEVAYLETARVMSRLMLMRNPGAAVETEQVATLAEMTARRLGVDSGQVEWLGVAATLRNIGKLGMIEQVVSKPQSLTDGEQALLRKHPNIAAELLAAVSGYGPLAQIIGSYTERFDGTGYPEGLAGEKIPLEARVLAVANSYVAMTSKRPHREAIDEAAARTELRESAGTQFDPKVVEVFFELLEEQP